MDYDAPLILTKLNIPRVSGGLVTRPQLIKQLNDGLNRKLTLVCAPAGYGKTTLLSQWLADRLHPVSWLSLDENDNDPITFLSYFVAAVQTIFPAACQATLSMLEAPQKPSLVHISSTLINELSEQDRPFLLVLDDFHTISDSEVHQLMDSLITYMPSEMHLVIASRRDFPFPLVRMRIGREITEIRMKELRFTHAEIKAYLSKDLKQFLKRQHIEHIRGAPSHPITQGKIERYHLSLKNIVKLQHYYSPSQLREAIADFVNYYNNQRYHESLDNMTPADVFYGKEKEVRSKREKIKRRTMALRRQQNLMVAGV
ncbi:integrase core domain-containing protein [Chloroflexota bacterium]